MFLTARQRHFNHTGGESDPQSMTLAVDLHADDALVLHTVYTAPMGGQEEKTEKRVKKNRLIRSILLLRHKVQSKKVGRESWKKLENEI